MSAISTIGGLSALSYGGYGAMMQGMQAAEESEGEEGELMLESQDRVEIEGVSNEDSDDAQGVEESSALGGQIDAWG